jgi:ParB family protein of integrating conjugative element (PFGI_1 class)
MTGIANRGAALMAKVAAGAKPVPSTTPLDKGQRPNSAAARQELARRSLFTENPLDNTDNLKFPVEHQMDLKVMDVECYDRNPRHAENDRYLEIKASIRNSRVLSPLVVTKRPGAQKYMVAAGGNTRLRALQELWHETHDPSFGTITVTFRPWVSEDAVLTAHLVENEVRGDMTFWDKANGIFALKELIEAELDSTLSLRGMESEFARRGLTVSKSVLGVYGFAIDNLGELGEAAFGLGFRLVQTLQSPLTSLQRYVTSHYGPAGPERWVILRDDTLTKLSAQWKKAAPLDYDTVLQAFDANIGLALNETHSFVREVRELIAVSPDDSIETIVKHIRNLVSRPSDQLEADTEVSSQRRPRVRALRLEQTLAAPVAEPAMSTLLTDVEASDIGDAPTKQVDSARSMVMVDAFCPKPNAGDVLEPPNKRAGRFEPDLRGEHTTSALAHAKAVASMACIDHLLHPAPAMPFGFYVELPDSDQAITQESESRMAWWMLANCSHQFDVSLIHVLPATSPFLGLADSDSDDVDAAQHGPEVSTALVGDPPSMSDFVRWLVDPKNEVAANASLALVASVRRSPVTEGVGE